MTNRRPSAAPTRYAPDTQALATEFQISEADVLAVIDARGGGAYSASVETGLANRFPHSDTAERQRAIARTLAAGVIVRTPMGQLRRPPHEDE